MMRMTADHQQDRTPVAWMITYDGEATPNVYLSETRAWDEMVHLDHHYPEHKRTIRPLYAHPEPSAEEARTTLVSLFRAFEAKRIPTTLPGCPDVLGYDDMADWFLTRFPAALPPSADTQRDAARYRALRPFLSADATGDGKRWALWCVLHKGEEEEVAIQIHARRPASDAEQARRDSGDPEWGPSADEMVDEMVAAAREVP